VNKLIAEEGLAAFRTILIITDFGFDMSAYEYETVFLQTFDISSNSNWLNGHDNSEIYPFGTVEFKNIMQKLYNVDHCMELDWVKEKIKDTTYEKIGYYSTFQSPEYIRENNEKKSNYMVHQII
jgi:hypothetical protein